MTVSVVPAYAALLGLLFVVLSVRVIVMRRQTGVGVGDGEGQLLRRHRVHANFAEYVPLALILLTFCEIQGLPGWAVHLLCAGLLAGRFVHAWGVSQSDENLKFRIVGMSLTFAVITLSSLAVLVQVVR